MGVAKIVFPLVPPSVEVVVFEFLGGLDRRVPAFRSGCRFWQGSGETTISTVLPISGLSSASESVSDSSFLRMRMACIATYLSSLMVSLRAGGEKRQRGASRSSHSAGGRPACTHRMCCSTISETELSAPRGPAESHLGDLLDMLVFDRPLRFDELLAVQDYLRANGSIQK